MKRVILAVAALACGEAPEGELFGRVEQEIYLPPAGTYGRESTGIACDYDWDGNVCYIPDNKDMHINFYASTCPAWWQGRFVDVWNELEPSVNALDDEWGFTHDTSDPAWRWSCTSAPTTVGRVIHDNDYDNHNVTGLGTLKQYRSGQLQLDPSEFEAIPGWWDKTDLQHKRFVRNVLRFLIAQQFGHGRYNGSAVMNGPDDTWFTTVYQWTPAMFNTMLCYNEDSGTSADCP